MNVIAPRVLSIPKISDTNADSKPSLDICIQPGDTITFCGANGSGKTRLSIWIEENLNPDAYRISAHRALSLNPKVTKISEDVALTQLRSGDRPERKNRRHMMGEWDKHGATRLLSDFDSLVQALFAEQTNTALKSHNRLRVGPCDSTEQTKFELLSKIWETLIPHRKLEITGDDIRVRVLKTPSTYSASEMSDGERAIFYLIGQTLTAADQSVLIIDEPELHLHLSIMTKLFDELAKARTDCTFIFVTHSLDFAASQPGKKFLVYDCQPAEKGGEWTLESLPEGTEFGEKFISLILGTRRPVLLVEGDSGSLDKAIYSAVFPNHLVLPMESCEAVINAVASLRNHSSLTRVEICSKVGDGALEAAYHGSEPTAYNSRRERDMPHDRIYSNPVRTSITVFT